MRVLTRLASNHPFVRLVPARHFFSFRGGGGGGAAAVATMALEFPVYAPARYEGQNEPVKRPKVRWDEKLETWRLGQTRL